jgi:hypothetical protein
MTQTLDVHERISDPAGARAASAPAAPATTAAISKFGTFAITFGIAFTIIYTVLERMNWPIFTYHPAVNQIYFWMHAARPGEDLGPPMYWYGWIALALPSAAVVAWIATKVSSRFLQCATLFCCTLAVLWPIAYAATVTIVNRPSYEPEYLDLMGYAAIPALVGAALVGYVGYFVPIERAQRIWTNWLAILPVGALVILGYSLKTWFTR